MQGKQHVTLHNLYSVLIVIVMGLFRQKDTDEWILYHDELSM